MSALTLEPIVSTACTAQNSDSSPTRRRNNVGAHWHWTLHAPFFPSFPKIPLTSISLLYLLLSLYRPFFASVSTVYPPQFLRIIFTMLGFTAVAAGISLKFSPGITRWDRKISLPRKSSNRQTIYAAVAEAAPPSLDGKRRTANLYEVLKVKYNASQTEIKTAYRALAKIYHPDVAAAVVKHPEESFDGRDFIEIHKAYATLSDPAAREIYDLTLRTASSLKQPLSCRYSRRVGFYTTRRWETDQCW